MQGLRQLSLFICLFLQRHSDGHLRVFKGISCRYFVGTFKTCSKVEGGLCFFKLHASVYQSFRSSRFHPYARVCYLLLFSFFALFRLMLFLLYERFLAVHSLFDAGNHVLLDCLNLPCHYLAAINNRIDEEAVTCNLKQVAVSKLG